MEEDEETIYFHIVAHSHDDVGWVNTPDEYYDQRVSQILTSVVEALLENPSRKFSQTEIYYFERWWKQQTEEV
jgi:lysosomal alpha-mannosidase